MADNKQTAKPWPIQGGPPPAGSVAWIVGVGASAGTGAAIARRLARGGCRVAVTGRTAEKVETVVREINEAGGDAVAVIADVGTEAGVTAAYEQVKTLGTLSVAIYNAGGSQWRPNPLEMDGDFFEQVWRTNCFGSFVVAREAARAMLETGGGAILFTGSISGVIARPKLTAYASAKFGQRAIAQAFAREYGPKNIHVANIIPHGPIDGDRLNSRFPHAKDARPEDGMIDIEQIAEAFWTVLIQPRNAWTHEMDLRPYCEPF
ncbi:SDR family NAD(P)-dependent oxidoreductase [Niveispirillum sp. KHB5.9]|uniref:SDR family NAD(P)-dependent oxidoreductase n=1 Tax=Niveispirillum sp. KHB5.9 TaxID=3400269 RepID=UPI003A83F111